MRVVALVHKDKDTSYGVSFPDFPGCISGGDTLTEAMLSAAEALGAHVAWMQADGDPIPKPRTVEELWEDEAFMEDRQDAVLVFVPAFIPGRPAQRVNISLDGDLLQEIDQAAKTFPGGRSGFLAEAAKEKLTRAA